MQSGLGIVRQHRDGRRVGIVLLTGISQSMVIAAPRIEEVLPTFVEFVGDSVIVAGHDEQGMRLHRYDHSGELVWELDRDDASEAIAITRSESDDIVGLGRSADDSAGILPWLGVVTP